ncbi:hypothetical protein BX666DRAFT_1858304 [Dichotomocladium elegans]|nr:hypothetical protein BX666DRAFT_1858304 [Dichotomocladium elegans]
MYASKSLCCSSSGADVEGFPDPKFPTSFYEHSTGRLFYKKSGNKSHFLPCDDEEIERKQINYYLFKAGPGFWINDMAEAYPNSHFTGTDFIIFPIRYDEWTTVINEIIRVTKPGGWIQLVEPGGLVQDIGPNLSIWLMRVTVSLQTRNIVMKIGAKIHEALEAHDDVEDVESGHRSFPIAWLGKLGDLGLEATERLIDSMKPRLCEDWSMLPAKYDKIMEAVAKECHEFGAWSNLHYAIGRKKIVKDETVL